MESVTATFGRTKESVNTNLHFPHRKATVCTYVPGATLKADLCQFSFQFSFSSTFIHIHSFLLPISFQQSLRGLQAGCSQEDESSLGVVSDLVEA